MRVVHLDAGREWRGGQRQSLILHCKLIERGVSSHLLNDIAGEQYQRAKSLAIDHVYGIRFPRGPLRWPPLKSRLLGLAPDVIHCHDSRSLGTVSPARTYRIVETRRVSYPIKWLSRRRKYSKADLHVGVSREIETYLKRYFDNVAVVPSCTEMDAYPDDDCPSPLQPAARHNILFVGALSPQKGVDILIKAFDAVHELFPDALLHVVGGGGMKKALLNLTASLGLSRHVVFYGARTRLAAYYRYSSILVVPSVAGEGCNGVIREGLANAIPVIASDLAANREILDDKRIGYLFENGNVDSLAKTLIQLLRGDLPYDAQAALGRAADFSCERMTDNYLRIYEHLLQDQSD